VKDEELAGEELVEGLEIEAGEGIDEEIVLAVGDLDEAELLEVAMEAIGLGIHGDGVEAGEV